MTGTRIDQIWPEPEPEFDRNFVNRQILLTKMATRLIILDCAGYTSIFKAVIVFGSKKTGFRSKKPDFRSKKSKNNKEGGFLLCVWEKNEASKKGRQKIGGK